MAKSYCKCIGCTTFECNDCTTCDICMAETGCKDDIPDKADSKEE